MMCQNYHCSKLQNEPIGEQVVQLFDKPVKLESKGFYIKRNCFWSNICSNCNLSVRFLLFKFCILC